MGPERLCWALDTFFGLEDPGNDKNPKFAQGD